MAVPDVGERSIGELVSLAGRVAVVTGAAMGIGRACAARLAEAGADVVLADIDLATAERAAAEISAAAGRKALAVATDVREPGDLVALADRAVAEFGRMDVWVNNAGIYPMHEALSLTDEEWDRVLEINLRGTFVGAREAAKRMVDGGHGGVIVNLASTAAFRAAGSGASAYVSSKHGVRGLTKALAVEFGSYGIRVLAVAPTLIETPGIRQLGAGGDEAIRALLDNLAQSLPLGRAGVADDVARVVLFAASDLSMLMTGSTLAVDAGDLAH